MSNVPKISDPLIYVPPGGAKRSTTYLSPGLRRDSKGKIIHAGTGEDARNKGNPRKPKEKQEAVRGKEVTIRDSAAPAQVIYGRMRVGGVTTMIHTDLDSSAYIITGAEDTETRVNSNGLVWTVRTAGAVGNSYTLTLSNPGASNPTTVCNYTSGGNIVVVLATNGSAQPTSTLNQVIGAVQANSAAWSLINVQKSLANTNGVVAAQVLTSFQYGGGARLHQIITLAGHEIEAVEKLYLDGVEVAFGASPDPRWATGRYAGRVFMAANLGQDDQGAQPDAIGQIPGIWTTDHKQSGCAHVYLIMMYNESVFPEGLPEIEFFVKGKKCYDPRTATTVWTQNAALIIADYLQNTRFGLGLDNVDTDGLIAAANICDILIPRTNLPHEPKYEFNSSFDPTEGVDAILSQMEQGIAGKIFSRDGKVFIYPGHWRAPSVTFTQDDLRGDMKISTHISRSDRFNCARGTITSEITYLETDIPPYKNPTYIAEDGGIEIYEDFPLNFVTSGTQAQRILKVELEKVRQGISVSIPLKLSGLLVNAGDVINLTLERFGWENKTFEVMSENIIIEDDGVIGVDLELRETAEAIFDWNAGLATEVDIAPNTTLPSATDVEPPSDIILTSGSDELYINGDGKIVSRMKVSWTPSTGQFSGRYQIRYAKLTDFVWIKTEEVLGDATHHYLLDVKDGVTYVVEMRAINTINIPSDWIGTEPHTVLGKSEPPDNVETFSATLRDFGIAFSWVAIDDLDADQYEIRLGTSWEDLTHELVYRGRGTSFRWDYRTAGELHFFIKAIDTSGNYSTTATEDILEIAVPTTPIFEDPVISGPNIKLAWSASIGSFAIREYEIRYGASFEDPDSVMVAIAPTLNLTLRVDWGGIRTFWIKARDIAGNVSDSDNTIVTIADPNPIIGLGVTNKGANVMLDWQHPLPGDLPIAEYHIYKGDTYATSVRLGIVYGTFHTYVERVGGVFSYHVIAIDTAGNDSTEVSVTSTISVPTDFFIRSDLELINSGDSAITDFNIENAVRLQIDPGATPELILFPIGGHQTAGMSLPMFFNTIANPGGGGSSLPWFTGTLVPDPGGEETWDQWWEANGWTTWQDAIDDGYDARYPTPTNTQSGYVEWVIDYSVTFASSFIDFFNTIEVLGDDLVITQSISLSEDGVSFTEYMGAAQLFATNFRYLKARIYFTGNSILSLAKLTEARVQISLKLEEETQLIQCYEDDLADPLGAPNTTEDGTLVTFTKDFLDIQDIQATPSGLTYAVAVVYLIDVPNPTFCRVLLFDKEGDRINGTAYIRIKGAVNPT